MSPCHGGGREFEPHFPLNKSLIGSYGLFVYKQKTKGCKALQPFLFLVIENFFVCLLNQLTNKYHGYINTFNNFLTTNSILW